MADLQRLRRGGRGVGLFHGDLAANVIGGALGGRGGAHQYAAVLPEHARQWIDMGFNIISWKADTALYGGALRSEVAALRQMTNK